MKNTYIGLFIKFLFVALNFFSNNLQAADYSSGDISYKYLGSNKYEIQVRVSQICGGILIQNIELKVRPQGFNPINLTPVITKRDTQNNLCISSASSCNGNFLGYGSTIRTYFLDTVDFSVAPLSNYTSSVCKFTFEMRDSRRLTCTNLSSASGFSIYAELDYCVAKNGNSNPVMMSKDINNPTFNNSYQFTIAALDSDHDSVAYELINAKNYNGSNASYASGYSAIYPVTPYCTPIGTNNCTPNIRVSPTRGVFFGKSSGNLVYTSIKTELSSVAFRITEYRNDSGTWKQVGYSEREIYLGSYTGPNNPPFIDAPIEVTGIAGDTLRFNFEISDDSSFNFKDSFQLITQFTSRYNNIQTSSYKNFRKRIYSVSIPTDTSDFRFFADPLVIFTEDNNCSRGNQKSSFNTRIKLKKRISVNRTYSKTPCGTITFKYSADSVYGKLNTFLTVTNLKGAPRFYEFNQNTQLLRFFENDTFIVKMVYKNYHYESQTFNDTLIINNKLELSSIIHPSNVCDKDSFTMFVNPKNATGKLSVIWKFKNDTLASKALSAKALASLPSPGTAFVSVTDSLGCKESSTKSISVLSKPTFNLGANKWVCPNERNVLRINASSISSYLWLPSNATSDTLIVFGGGSFVLKATDIFGCSNLDTIVLNEVTKRTIVGSNDTAVCTGNSQTFSMLLTPSPGNENYSWRTLPNYVLASPSKTVFFTAKKSESWERSASWTENGKTCFARDTMTATAIALPNLSTNNISLCYQTNSLNLGMATGLDAKFGVGNVIFNSFTDPALIAPGGASYFFATGNINNATIQFNPKNVQITAETTDPNTGCFGKDTFAISVNGSPIVVIPDTTRIEFYKNCVWMDSLVQSTPKALSQYTKRWKLLRAPAGVSLTNTIKDQYAGTGLPPRFLFCFGNGQDEKFIGRYMVEYTFRDTITKCETKDTAYLYVDDFVNTKKITPASFVLYPNPVPQGTPITIEFNKPAKESRLILINDLGQTLEDIYTHNSSVEIPTQKLKPGNYYLKIISENGIELQKVLIL